MAAALVVASHEAADDLGVPIDQRVYLRGWCYGTDPVYVAEHDPTWAIAGDGGRVREALDAAGVGIDDVAHLDLYSCFPSSVGFALDALGLEADDPRGFTVTGGLPFAGGAGSDYMTHSIAAMVDVLRDDPGSLGLVQRRRHAHDEARVRRLLDLAAGNHAGSEAGRAEGATTPRWSTHQAHHRHLHR